MKTSEKKQFCEWQHDNDIYNPDTWKSDCGLIWLFADGGPSQNEMIYCCKCGKKLIEKTEIVG